ncbi:DUF305 domain-containing protein [Nocardioides stalactiti]|uniref:DUF305 domain-containing protein n=1 Tax=Nocardioides stalactiti TaxID=2755356 RepID=UPI0016037711|nr:DUF305 domain-containing protein [Nocardioides stalactiti]
MTVLPALLARTVLVATTALVVTACGDDEPTPAPALRTADNGEVFNDADAAFATALVEQHAVTLVLIDLARAEEVSPEITAAGEEILAARALEIEQATDWLLAWDVPVPETIRDHANVPHGEELTTFDDPELSELTTLDGAAFEERWLDLMIDRHQAATDLAEAEVEDGRYEPAITLAQALAEDQQARIEELETLRSR